jgi:hypothetical protein
VHVEEVPEAVGGITRLLSIQRKLFADYLVTGDKRALDLAAGAIPNLTKTEKVAAFADYVHSL